MNKPKVSIIIRTKNEERWIASCLNKIFNQSYKDFEIIIVDNESDDRTIDKAKEFSIKKIVNISNYLPGKALNLGIEIAEGKYIVCISAHCIPTNNNWLQKLVSAIEEDKSYAGVYGRQQPMSFSSPSDKRDLLLVFGLDRKIQIKDSFFHNANSIIRRELWENNHFDEKITNIEDRLWAGTMLKEGYKFLYEPEASVFHYHGIHQDGNNERLNNVVKIIENYSLDFKSGQLDAKELKIIAIIPIKGESKLIDGNPLLKYSIDSLKKSKYIDRIFVSTDSQKTADLATRLGAECPYIRPKNLSDPFINLEKVQEYSLNRIESEILIPDLVVHLEETFPFRPNNLFDGMIINLLKTGYDSVIAARRESNFIWQEEIEGSFKRIDSGDVPRQFKEKSLIGLHGLGVVTHPEFIRNSNFLGSKIGLFEVNDALANFEIRGNQSLAIAKNLLNNKL
jgi:glycosyltransferase involved in cell wall biosynthesis